MLSKTELKILALLFEDLNKEYTIREISLVLRLPYPQTHRSIRSLLQKKLVGKKIKGKASLIHLKMEEKHDEYILVEIERKEDVLRRYKILHLIANDLEKIKSPFICILFGSYAEKKARMGSDIDLLFVIPDECDYTVFEKVVKNVLTMSKIDINITTENGLLEMWKNPLKLNVGNEIIKKNIVLYGMERLLHLRRNYYIG